MAKEFNGWRICSTTRPSDRRGLPESNSGEYSREELESLTARSIGFYRNGESMRQRGPERYTESFELQGRLTATKKWLSIKSIKPLDGTPGTPRRIDLTDTGLSGSVVIDVDLPVGAGNAVRFGRRSSVLQGVPSVVERDLRSPSWPL